MCCCKHRLFILLLLLSVSCSNQAEPGLSTPEHAVILEISGSINVKNSNDSALFDRTMLDSLAQTKIITGTPWTDGVSEFQGPLLRDLLELVGATGTELHATALNNYEITIPMADVVSYPVIVASKMDGKRLSIRSKGPLWVIYPWNNHNELKTETYYQRSIWQLRSLSVR